MKRLVLMIVPALVCGMVLTSCSTEKEAQVSNVNFTPCVQSKVKSTELLSKVDIKFTDEGVQITYYDFAVTCDFSTVNVTHTFVNGFLNITQQGSPNQANCVCYTDVSYTIEGITQNEVNVIFINGVQVYCYNENEEVISNCDQNVIVSATEYENAPDFPNSVIDMKIAGNCLKIQFGASGCNPNNWIVNLIAVPSAAAVFPPEWALRLSNEKQEVCTAWFSKEISFNIEELQIQGSNRVRLNISGNTILYEY